MAPIKTVGLLCAVAMAVMVLGIVLTLCGCASDIEKRQGSASTGGMGSTPIGESPSASYRSTPRSQWAKGLTPALYQADPEWAYAFYADGTILTHGCGPTALAMAFVRLTGSTDLDPRDLARFSEENGFIDCGVTSWMLMSEGARQLGLHSRELGADAKVVKAELMKGNQVICSVHAGDFTSKGHFILLADMNPDGTVEIRDPNSEARTQQSWDLDRIISQCDNLWSLSS